MPSAEQDRELDRRIAALAIPALGSIAAEPLYNLADTLSVRTMPCAGR
jgi:Na+-driven multidrug efflux pump